MKWCFAAMWEIIADAIPDAPALIAGEVRRSWREYENRAARFAAGLAAAGLGPDSKVGLYALNSNEYLEAQFGLFKVRGGPINVNYRYTEGELTYLLDNADATGLVFDARFAPRVRSILPQLPALKTLIEIDDGTGEHLEGAIPYEALIDQNAPLARRDDYSEDDIYMFYTGGTTGMPKGVMYRQGDFARVFVAAYEPRIGSQPQTAEALTQGLLAIRDLGLTPVSLPACPLMHGTGLWLGAWGPQALGAAVVNLRDEHFDAGALWRTVERERVTDIAIVGDAFARPMLAALDAARAAGRPYDLSSLQRIGSSGVMFSREIKEGLLAHADIVIRDTMGSTEGGMAGSEVSRASPPGETAKFVANETTKVFNDRDEEIEPGSDEIGMVANGGATPLGYYKDPAKSAATFRTIRGHRYSFPGDFAKLAADGTLILLGRGSVCINTGGEKVFPEEVEEALKAHPDVCDCLVVGVADTRFGERVTAVLSLTAGGRLDETALTEFVRGRIAGYKLPRRFVVVDEVRRAANGKADYKWAKTLAAEMTPAV